jgi:hypothetical protein
MHTGIALPSFPVTLSTSIACCHANRCPGFFVLNFVRTVCMQFSLCITFSWSWASPNSLRTEDLHSSKQLFPGFEKSTSNEAFANYQKVNNAISQKQFSVNLSKQLLLFSNATSLAWDNLLSASIGT